MKEILILTYLETREKQNNWKHSNGINEKLPKIQMFPDITNISVVTLCHFTLFAIFRNNSLLRIFERNFFLWQVVTQTETRSYLTPMIGFNYLPKLATEIRFCDGNRKHLKSLWEINEWTESVKLLHRAVIRFIIICLPTEQFTLTVKGPLRFIAFIHCPSETQALCVNIRNCWEFIFYIIHIICRPT